MKITVKLMATLRSRLPPGSQGGKAVLELDSGDTVASVLQRLGIPRDHVHLAMVNGEMELNHDRALADGDELVMLPPVAGG
jgi:molybdopterin converting factor small subunit